MRTIEWKKRNGTMEAHCIYSVEEAKRLGVKYLDNWRDGEIGDWVATDDECVVQVLRASRDSRDRKLIGTCTMTTNSWSKKCKLDTQHRQSRYSINGKVRNDTPKHMTASLSEFCILVAAGIPPEEAYLKVFYERNTGKTQSNTYVKRRAKKLMEAPIVQRKIQESLGDDMDKLGLTRDWILRRYKSQIETGENESAIATMLNKLSQFRGMDGQAPVLPNLPAIPQETLDKLARTVGFSPITVSNEVEPKESKIVSNGPITDAEVEERKDNEEVYTHVGPVGAFNPDAD